MRDEGHDVRMASLHLVDADEPFGAYPLVEPPIVGQTPLHVLPGAIRRLRALAREFRPDVTLTYYLSSYGMLGALAGLRPAVAATAGGDILEDPYDTTLRRLKNRAAFRLVLPRTDRFLAWAEHVGDRLVALGVPRDRILVMPRGVDLDLFAYRAPRVRSADDPIRILSMRLLKPLYSVHTLVEALVALAQAGVPFEARLAGDGPERARLKQMVDDAGLSDRVTFLGLVPADDVPRQIAWSDVTVSTSSTDGASSSLFESMAMGSAVVVTDIPASASFVTPGKTGELFPVGDSGALTDRLRKLAAEDEHRRDLIANAHAFAVDRLDYARNMSRITEFVVGAAAG